MAGPSPETKLGRWRLIERLAETSHSVVWLAQDEGGGPVAVKELRVRRSDKEAYRRFRDEVRFHLERGDRPGILPLLDAYVPDRLQEGERAWLAMPLAQTLPEALGVTGGLDRVVEAIAVCARTLAGLAA